MLANRLERRWEFIKPQILGYWTDLSAYDLVGVEGRFDRLVEVIRKKCMPQRSHVVVEAAIRDWLIERIKELEGDEYEKV
jgi:hypothetical protein